MNLVAAAAELLSKRLGLSPELLGSSVVVRALDAVIGKAGLQNREERAARLLAEEGEEWQKLVDEVIVPETWFFRDSEPFQFLASYVTEKWRPANPARTYQALCIPCASGEEPYSVGMTLLDAGLEAGRIRIDAADVSDRTLARARVGIYGRSSFREKSGRFREEYFVNCEEGRRVREEVTHLVRIEKANLLDLSVFRQRAPYDAIFCRNALIYLDERARHEVASAMRELLNEEGLLFTGHSELTHFCEAGFVPVDYPKSFACRRGEPTRDRASAGPPAATLGAAAAHRATVTRRAAPAEAGRPQGARAAPEQPPGLEQAEQLADRGDLEGAAALCERLLAGGAQDPDVYALLGVISESVGNVGSAEEFFRKALYLTPHHYVSLLHMSVLCERRGDIESSRLYRARAGRSLARQEGNQVIKSL